MIEIILGIIFIGTFYIAFKTIWKNVTTVSYNGLEGFLRSWGNQLFWAFIIAVVVTTIVGHILESIMQFGRSLNFNLFDILCYGVGAYIILALIFSKEDTFDKKTFRENFNTNITELNKKLNFDDDVFHYVCQGNPANLTMNDERKGATLFLGEEFVSLGSSKLIEFPNVWINHSVNKSGNYTSIKLFLKHLTCDDEQGRVAISAMEHRVARITFTAAIEAVAKGKSHAIESALDLINEHGAFGFLGYGAEDNRQYSSEGVDYIVYRNRDYVSLEMIKLLSEGK